MIFASGDPLNFILAVVWTVILASSIGLTWYAYIRWKRFPDESLSANIARSARRKGILFGIWVGITVGFVVGMFVGHWFWPVEIEALR